MIAFNNIKIVSTIFFLLIGCTGNAMFKLLKVPSPRATAMHNRPMTVRNYASTKSDDEKEITKISHDHSDTDQDIKKLMPGFWAGFARIIIWGTKKLVLRPQSSVSINEKYLNEEEKKRFANKIGNLARHWKDVKTKKDYNEAVNKSSNELYGNETYKITLDIFNLKRSIDRKVIKDQSFKDVTNK